MNDETGQVSLADALAMGTSAHNLILLGDPLQFLFSRNRLNVAVSRTQCVAHVMTSPAARVAGEGVEEIRLMNAVVRLWR